MQTTNQNPPVTPLLRWVTTLEAFVVLGSGAGLFFLPAVIGPLWPWALTPFNAGFLGSIYLAALVAAVSLALAPRWSPARVVVPMILAFTAIVLFVSILYLDRLNLQSPSTWLWFVLYIGIPLNSAYHVWLYRRLPPVDPRRFPNWWRIALMVESLFFLLYGVVMFVVPGFSTGFWPWPIDEFHARIYCVGPITVGVGAYALSRFGSRLELFVMGMTQLVGGVFAILGLLMVYNRASRVDWSLVGTWLWIGLFLILVVSGTGKLLQASRKGQQST